MEERRAEMEPQSPHYSPSDDRTADPSEKVHRWKAIMQEETISARQKEALAEKVRQLLQTRLVVFGLALPFVDCIESVLVRVGLFFVRIECTSFRIKSNFYPEHGFQSGKGACLTGAGDCRRVSTLGWRGSGGWSKKGRTPLTRSCDKRRRR